MIKYKNNLTQTITTIGKNYNANLTIKEIGKLAKKEIKKIYPNLKINVRTYNNYIYKSIEIDVKVKEINNKNLKIKSEIIDILNTFNYSIIEPLSDFSQYNFTSIVNLR